MYEDSKKIIGEKISQLRRENGFSQIDFATQCGIDKTNLGRIERGEVHARIDTLILISNMLGITVSELLIDIK
jgi:transcriptional regulator with XRE-family HTH domain